MNASKRLTRMTAAALSCMVAASPLVVPAASYDFMPRYTLRVSPGNFGEFAVNTIQPGMSQVEVTTLIGAPNSTAMPSRGGTQLDYNYVDTWGYDSVFSVVIDGGVVVNKASVRRRY